MLTVVGAFTIALLKQHRRVTARHEGMQRRMPKPKAVPDQSFL